MKQGYEICLKTYIYTRYQKNMKHTCSTYFGGGGEDLTYAVHVCVKAEQKRGRGYLLWTTMHNPVLRPLKDNALRITTEQSDDDNTPSITTPQWQPRAFRHLPCRTICAQKQIGSSYNNPLSKWQPHCPQIFAMLHLLRQETDRQ